MNILLTFLIIICFALFTFSVGIPVITASGVGLVSNLGFRTTKKKAGVIAGIVYLVLSYFAIRMILRISPF